MQQIAQSQREEECHEQTKWLYSQRLVMNEASMMKERILRFGAYYTTGDLRPTAFWKYNIKGIGAGMRL